MIGVNFKTDAVIIGTKGGTTFQGPFHAFGVSPGATVDALLPASPVMPDMNAAMTAEQWSRFQRFTRANRRVVRSLLPSCFHEDYAFEGYHPDLGWYVDVYQDDNRYDRLVLRRQDDDRLVFVKA